MEFRKATVHDIDMLTALACRLWPCHTKAEMQSELTDILLREDAAFFLAMDGDVPVGFAQCQLRHDYVEGTDHSPVGYLEGIYVAEEHRHQGIAKALVSACEAWARNKGCLEFASDCELTNTQSMQFHLNVGFEEVNRIICFVKKL